MNNVELLLVISLTFEIQIVIMSRVPSYYHLFTNTKRGNVFLVHWLTPAIVTLRTEKNLKCVRAGFAYSKGEMKDTIRYDTRRYFSVNVLKNRHKSA